MKSKFKSIINWNKHESKVSIQTQNQFLNYLSDPGFQGVNILFALSFENHAHVESHKRYFLLTVENKNYNVIIEGKNFFDQPVKNDIRTYENIGKIATCEGDDYTIVCL